MWSNCFDGGFSAHSCGWSRPFEDLADFTGLEFRCGEAVSAACVELEGGPHLAFLSPGDCRAVADHNRPSITRRIRGAHFCGLKALDSFDWQFNNRAIERPAWKNCPPAGSSTGMRTSTWPARAAVRRCHLVQFMRRPQPAPLDDPCNTPPRRLGDGPAGLPGCPAPLPNSCGITGRIRLQHWAGDRGEG